MSKKDNESNSKPTPPVDDDQTEELLSPIIPFQVKKRKKLFIIFGIFAGVCILTALIFFILGQMKASEINKSLDLGEKYLEECKYEEAILAFDDVIAIDQKQVSAYEGKAEVYVATKKYDEAEKTLLEAQQIEPRSKTNLLLVEVYDNTQKPDEAKKLFEETIVLLETDIKKSSNKAELTKLYDQLISTCKRIGKDNDYIKELCDRAQQATGDSKYETLKKSFEVGNTSGNLNNGGYAALQNDWIYYRNSSDNNSLYKIKTNNAEKAKLVNDDSLNINVIGDWVYYINSTDNASIYKIKTDGTERTKINNNRARCLNVIGDWIYYANGNDNFTIYKMKIDGTEQAKLTNSDGFKTTRSITVSDDWIYYTYGVDFGRQLKKIKLDGTEETALISSCFCIQVVDCWIYYSNYKDYYRIYKLKIDGTEITKISNDLPVQIPSSPSVNVAGDWIYFSNMTDNHALYKVHTDGTGETKIVSDKCVSINVVGDWIYYKCYEISSDQNELYRIRTDGSDRQKVS